MKSILGKDYQKYDLVIATDYGLPIGEAAIRKRFKKLIKDHDLLDVVFHSLRHTSVTYKLKLNGGDIKAVQGDSGHSQVNMVTLLSSLAKTIQN
jgi:integrase